MSVLDNIKETATVTVAVHYDSNHDPVCNSCSFFNRQKAPYAKTAINSCGLLAETISVGEEYHVAPPKECPIHYQKRVVAKDYTSIKVRAAKINPETHDKETVIIRGLFLAPDWVMGKAEWHCMLSVDYFIFSLFDFVDVDVSYGINGHDMYLFKGEDAILRFIEWLENNKSELSSVVNYSYGNFKFTD